MEDEDLYANLPQFDHKENLEKEIMFSTALSKKIAGQESDTLQCYTIFLLTESCTEDDLLRSKALNFSNKDILQDSNKDLQEQVSHLKEIVEKLTQENVTLKSNCTQLGKNISSLIKTARTEIKRKDARIAELNKENSLFKTRLRLPRNRLQELKQVRQQDQRSETVREDRNGRKHNTSTSGERGGSQGGRENWRSQVSPQRKRFCGSSGERGSSNRLDGGPSGDRPRNYIEERALEIPSPCQSSKEQKSNSNNLNFCSQSAEQIPDPPQIKNVPRVPKINLPTLYSKRMFNKIYNIEPTKVESNDPNENNIEKSITTNDQKDVENPNISSKDISGKFKPTFITTTASSAILQPENTNMTVSSIMTSLCVKTMEENNKLNLSGSDIKISNTKPIDNELSNKIVSDSTHLTDKTKDENIEDPQSVELIASSEIPVTSQEKDEMGTSLKIVADAVQKVKLIDQKKEFISLEEELHLSSDSRIDSTSANIVDIQVNIQSNVSDIPVAELKSIITNLNKFTDSTKAEESHSSINDIPKLNQTVDNIIQPVNESTSKINTTTSPSHEIDYKNTEKFCSTTLGLRLLNRQTKTTVKPVSAQWCETYKKNVENEDLLRNKSESFPLVHKSPPHTEDKENEKHDLVESLFGSPLKWTENSVDDVMPKLCPPPSAFEDSCSAQIENTKFKKHNTESVSSTKTVKEIIVSKNENDMSTMTTIESRISVQKIKEIPRRPFEQINNEKNEKSNFSSYLENTTEACDVPSFTLTTLSGSVKSMRKSPFGSKYHDSILGQFDDTTQLISALAKEHSKVSPINTPIKENKTETPEKKLTANVSKTNQHQKVATPLNSCFTKKTILSSSIVRAPEKKTIFLDKPINILCPRRKTKASPKVTLKTQPIDRNKNKEEIKDKNTVSDQKITSQQNNKSSACPSELNNKKIIENNKEIDGIVPLEKNNLKRVSLSEKHNTTNSKRNDNYKDAKRLSLSNKHDGTNSGHPRDDYKGYNSRRVPSTEKCDDSDSKRHLSHENHRDDYTKQLSSEKNIGSDSKKQFIDEEHRINNTKRPSHEKYHDRDSKRPPSPEKNDVTKRRFSHEKYKENSSKRMSSSEKYDDSSRRRRSNEKYLDSNSRRPSPAEKYDRDSSRRRQSNEKYLDSNSRRPSPSEKYDRDSSRRRKDNESSSSRRHESYKQYYDERGRKKVPFTTISSKTTVSFKSPSPRRERSPFKDSRSDKSHLSSTATFKRPLSYQRIRRSNCLFRETSVERRVLKDARHRIRKTPIRIIKRKDAVAHLDRIDISQNSKGTVSTSKRRDDAQSETIASPKEDHSCKPTHIVRSSNKIDWSATTTQVVSTQPVNISPKPKPESLMKWVLQPIDFGPLVSRSPREIIWKNLEITSPPPTSRQNITPSKAGGQEITPQKSSPIVIISRKRPIKFGVCENNAQICQTAKES